MKKLTALARVRALADGLPVLPLLLLSLGGCATPPADPAARAAFERNNDPLEPLNRKIFAANQFADRIVLKPVAQGYVAVVPANGRLAIRHVLDNLKEPTLFLNNLLQGEVDRAAISAGRFAINTTIGLGGTLDIATRGGMPRQNADFGQTLYVWGVPDGPFLMLPLVGPSNVRDTVGGAVDSYADPATVLGTIHDIQELLTARFLVDGIDKRADALDTLDELQKNSLDFYAELRSLSQQERAAELRRGAAPSPDAGFYSDPAHPASGPATPAAVPPGGAVGAPQPANPSAAGSSAHPRPSSAAPPPAPPMGIISSSPLRWSVDPEEGPLLTAEPGSSRP